MIKYFANILKSIVDIKLLKEVSIITSQKSMLLNKNYINKNYKLQIKASSLLNIFHSVILSTGVK